MPVPGKFPPPPPTAEEDLDPDFQYITDQFADIRILRYQVPGFNELSLQQKKLLYYLYEAALSGRDITWDQNYKQNLRVRRVLENVLRYYTGPREGEAWHQFEVYAKRVFFSNGIHHHYSTAKILPACSREYFRGLLKDSPTAQWPLTANEATGEFFAAITDIIFNPKVAAKRVNLTPGQDLLTTSAMNFYEGVTQQEAEAFYAARVDKNEPRPISWGLNSKLVKDDDGKIKEEVWKETGMYGAAIQKIVFWLERAVDEAENEQQRDALRKLIVFYKTGDLKAWDDYSIAWTRDTESRTDAVSGFIETYGDPLDYRATYESMVSFKDQQASRQVKVICDAAQWFEDNAPVLAQHKKQKAEVIGARVITTVVAAGDVAPVTPIGIHLPNTPWIREEYGAKSVSLGNVVYAGNEAGKRSGIIEEFACDTLEVRRAKKYSTLATALYTGMHEVIGHASGQLNPGVPAPKETLKTYALTIEETRADLMALYYILDEKLVQLGVMPSLEVGRAQYDAYLRDALLVQLARLAPGENLEEPHMRNRALIGRWAYEMGRTDSVIVRVERAGKTYFQVRDYNKLRELFGVLLCDIQSLTSEGDYEAAKTLVETYGVQVESALHRQVYQRYGKLGVPPYQGFIQPRLVPVLKGAAITDIRIEYPTNFLDQMLEYGKAYSVLPNVN